MSVRQCVGSGFGAHGHSRRRSRRLRCVLHIGHLLGGCQVLGNPDFLLPLGDFEFGNSRFLDEVDQFLEFAQIHALLRTIRRPR
ncbi:hypothetical protein SDC9_182661 [bioreactor metagenome]|uniref:Uncharacterized protein n=1 Tax=bioreactor metagenome TaxID=1076179 RepID=A0A645H9H9_9ZZZZ